MGSRQHGKHFPGCPNENARPSLIESDGFFVRFDLKNGSNEIFQSIFELTEKNAPTMIIRHNFRVSLITLILCLCAGSLTFLSFNQVNSFVLDISEVEAEDHEPFDGAEFEDDFLVSITGAAIAEASLSASNSRNLDFQSAFFSPLTPPPKYA